MEYNNLTDECQFVYGVQGVVLPIYTFYTIYVFGIYLLSLQCLLRIFRDEDLHGMLLCADKIPIFLGSRLLLLMQVDKIR